MIFTIHYERETLKNLNMVNLNGEKLNLHLSCKNYKTLKFRFNWILHLGLTNNSTNYCLDIVPTNTVVAYLVENKIQRFNDSAAAAPI